MLLPQLEVGFSSLRMVIRSPANAAESCGPQSLFYTRLYITVSHILNVKLIFILCGKFLCRFFDVFGLLLFLVYRVCILCGLPCFEGWSFSVS